MGFILPTIPAPDDCSCGARALNDWDGHMSWPDAVFVKCPACGKQGPKVQNPQRRKWPIAAETRAVDLWNEMQRAEVRSV